MSTKVTLRHLLETQPYVLAPEIYDCISAKCVEACGFQATVLSSGEFANSYGLPDLGLLTLDDVVDVTTRICNFSSLPMVVDAEEGYGRAIHAYMAAERLMRAGAAGILMTDLVDIGIKGALSVKEASQRFKAAKAGMAGTSGVLIARTEMNLENLQESCDRCNSYVDSGADMTLIHFGINKPKVEKTELCAEIAKRVPGWKWFPDLEEADHVDLNEVAKMGFNFIGVHYLQTSAMEAMLDYGVHVYERQNNTYTNPHMVHPENAPKPYLLGLDRWYKTENDILQDSELTQKGNYKMMFRLK
jgi:methylisocitrate lyase